MANKRGTSATDQFLVRDWRDTDDDTIYVEQPLAAGWLVVYEIRVIPSGTPVVASITVVKPRLGPEVDPWAEERERLLAVDEWGEDEQEWLRAEYVRRVKPGQALSAVRRDLEIPAPSNDVEGYEFMGNFHVNLEAHERIKPGKRRTRTDLDLAKIAVTVVRAQARGGTADDVARELGYAPGTVRHLIYESRERDLLLPKKPGQGARRVRNTLTDKALRLLEEHGQTGSHVESP